MDLRDAIKNLRATCAKSNIDTEIREAILGVCLASEQLAPERRLVTHDGYGRRKRQSVQRAKQGNWHRSIYSGVYSTGRRADDKCWRDLPMKQRTGPTDRRKVRVAVDTEQRKFSIGRREYDGRIAWTLLPLATPLISEAEIRARRAVAAIPGAKFGGYEDGFACISNQTYGIGQKQIDAINALLDRVEAAEGHLDAALKELRGEA